LEQLPIGALIPEPFGTDASLPKEGLSFAAADTRHSTNHPLRHAAINTVRQLADYRAAQNSNDSPPVDAPDAILTTRETEAGGDSEGEESRNGSNYLLTDRTFFISHEPCIMCSMALLHSRVKEVVYMFPMPKTGGCGGSACLPILKGVNHRFAILQWKLDHSSVKALVQMDLELDRTIDV
jgi:tRNA-specific adenosine deaminase 3